MSIPAPPTTTLRFASVDALRGVTVAAMLLVNDPGDWSHVYAPLEHAQWNGFTPTDLVFPLFLFVVGVSIALGVVPRLDDPDSRVALQRGVLERALRIVVLGLLLNAVAWLALDQGHVRPWGVLQRIGLCFALAGTIALHVRPRAQWALVAAILLGYWALLASGGTLAPWLNLASRVDTALLGSLLYQFDAASGRGHDPEGLLSTLPAIATTLIGLRAGDWLRRGCIVRLLVAGAASLVLGGTWSAWFPINKNLWTSSYVLWSAGWSLWLLAAFHGAIDRRGWPAIGRRFGINAIAAYAGSALMVYVLTALGWWDAVYRIGFAGWMTPRFGPFVPSLAFAIAFVAVWWNVMRAMDARHWRVRI